MQENDLRHAKEENIEPSFAHAKEQRPAGKWYTLCTILFFPLSFLYLEFFLKLLVNGYLLDRFLLYIFLFAFSAGLFLYWFSHLFKNQRTVRTVSLIMLFIICLLFTIEYFCTQTFTFYMGLQIIFAATGDVMQSYSLTIFEIILYNFHIILLFFVPFFIYLFVFKKPLGETVKKVYTKIIPLCTSVFLYLVAILVIFTSTTGTIKDKEYYRTEFDVTESAARFGLTTALRLDTEYLIFGTPASPLVDVSGEDDFHFKEEDPTNTSPSDAPSVSPSNSPVIIPEYSENKMNIDFTTLAESENDPVVKEMHEYFEALPASKQNEYTGIFKGKNLIFLTAEAFSPHVIDPERTPTLYRLANECFVFKDYYQPSWGVSTSDGEYSALTGLVPKSGTNSMKVTANNNNYFTMGNQLLRTGYNTYAYHNNTYTYYSRHITHPTLGYEAYIGVGNGLDNLSPGWPRSDLEMLQQTTGDYISNTPFHAYYMTVSGHCMYTFDSNVIARKNKDAVKDIDASEPIQGYLATNLELEYALTYLIDELEASGQLDNTVIVLTADHYPYGLERGFQGNDADYISELLGHTPQNFFEVHQNTLIIWNSEQAKKEPVIIEEPCYSLDILPTLSNLFGLEYDSRLLPGRDVFSNIAPLVLFRNYSWITEKGYYDASTDTFTATTEEPLPEGYVERVTNHVKTNITYSKLILEKNYYNILFGKDDDA
ncbi:MAG: LTA synthase family protein [Christensenellaceae bacterium]|jgi:lipoteichoic acid synthase